MERILDLFAPLNSKLNGLKRQAWDHRLSMFGHYLNVTASASGTLLMATTSSILLFLLPQLWDVATNAKVMSTFSWQIQNFHWILKIKIHPNLYSLGYELQGSPPPPQASPSMPPQTVGWTEKVAVSFHSAQWIFQKEMALWKRRPKEGKVGEEGCR